MWDPIVFTKENIWCNDNYVIVQGKWLNISHMYFMVNVYGPQDSTAKTTLWRSLISFVQHHQGRYVFFRDLNEVRDKSERSRTNYSRLEPQVFNNFVADYRLHEMTMGGKSFTWMNKLGIKMSKLDRFLLSEEVLDDNHDLKAIVLDRVWSNHSPILLHALKTDYGLIPFKIFHSWFNRKDIDMLKFIKYRLKAWNSESKKNEVNCKQEVIALVQYIDHKIDTSLAFKLKKETRLQLLHELHNIDRMESMELFQKAHIKWDIEGDKNTKFFHALIKQYRRRQAIQWIMVDGTWVSNTTQVKEAFLSFSKRKFQRHVPQVNCTDHSSFSKLSNAKSNELEKPVTSDEIRKAVWDCRSRSWIQECLRSARTFILVNGSPTLEFSIKRGLRQGMRLSYFFYADDVILVTEWNQAHMDNIIRLFNVFYLASGLRINIHKSNIYGIGVSNNDIEEMARVTGCTTGYLPLAHLLSRWKTNLLSIGGRSTLVKAVLGSIGIYYMSIFKVPETIISSLERLRSKCLDMLESLKAEMHSLSLLSDRDILCWGLSHDASFTVGDTRKHINDVILPTLSMTTNWCNILPRKVNIFIWRMRLDRLPHRLNLSRRGLDIQSIDCPICNNDRETNDHIFFSCDVASNIWRLVHVWSDLSIPLLHSFSDWES
ncbi:RNA-directed DNA polymerase, eukaryota, reverse transcriptase zinc-binding domain protein [Tanacetum coccineum]